LYFYAKVAKNLGTMDISIDFGGSTSKVWGEASKNKFCFLSN
jgi:pantothenate kinase